MSDAFDAAPGERFTFGLWTVGNPGRDPFGGPVRAVPDPCALVAGLARCGASGVNLHDDDLVPPGSSAAVRDRIVADFQRALSDHGLRVPMATTNLFGHPVFKDGAFTADDPGVRAHALAKTRAAIELGQELGATIHVFWGGREGSEADAARDPRSAIERLREALDGLAAWVKSQRFDVVFALEAKPNEPRSDIYLPTTGHMLHLISTLEHRDIVGVNPEVAHETMAGLSMTHAVAQAMEAGKLFHIDLNAQKIGRYDQDLRFGSEDLKGAFLLVRLLEGTSGWKPGASSAAGAAAAAAAGSAAPQSGATRVPSARPAGPQVRYDGPLHFDAHAYRTEDMDGVWDFARGCMRTYRILAAKARAFDADPDVRELIAEGRERREAAASGGTTDFDPDRTGAAGLRRERLDQLLMEHLLGVRG